MPSHDLKCTSFQNHMIVGQVSIFESFVVAVTLTKTFVAMACDQL